MFSNLSLARYFALVVVFTTSTLQALTIANYSDATNDRFTNDPSFFPTGYDFSGVGRPVGGGTWATMIADNIFLSSFHAHPANNAVIEFYPDNDPTSTPITKTVVGGTRISGTDLWVGHLDFAVGPTISLYSLPTETLSETAPSPLFNSYTIMVGNKPTGTTSSTNQAMAENHLEGFIEDFGPDGASSFGDALLLVQNLDSPVDTSAGYTYENHEGYVQSGDSGSPLFLTDGPNLVLAGIAWAQVSGVTVGGQARNTSAYTYTGNYLTEIQAYIDINLNTAIPEPTTGLLSLMAIATVLLRRQRKK